MESNNIKTVSCIQITPNQRIYQFKIKFDFSDLQSQNDSCNSVLYSMQSKMKLLYGCNFYKPRIAKAIYPDNTFFHAFYQDDSSEDGKPLNTIASHLINYIYNCDNSYNTPTNTNKKCYGSCYIICLDDTFYPIDSSTDTFINSYNKVHTTSGVDERGYFNRIFKTNDLNKCYLYNDYVEHCKQNKDNCDIM